MTIGVLVPTLGEFGEEGRYNRQEVGLSKVLAKAGYEVIILRYRRGPSAGSDSTAVKRESAGISELRVSARGIGVHGLAGTSFLNALNLKSLVVFGDNQMAVPGLCTWARKNGVTLIPYLGTLKSSSRRAPWFGDYLGRRNLQEYRRLTCFAKTPAVQAELVESGVEDVRLMPVGLDVERLSPHRTRSATEARVALGVPVEGPLVGFVGKLAPYKDPLSLVPVLVSLRSRLPGARLAVLGEGPLGDAMDLAAKEAGVAEGIHRIAARTQDEMWQLYRAVDALVNLNPTEIFGMALLEALYYGCPVVAVEAPGPQMILEGTPGRLVPAGQPEAVAAALAETVQAGLKDDPVWERRVSERFTWEGSVREAGLLDVLSGRAR